MPCTHKTPCISNCLLKSICWLEGHNDCFGDLQAISTLLHVLVSSQVRQNSSHFCYSGFRYGYPSGLFFEFAHAVAARTGSTITGNCGLFPLSWIKVRSSWPKVFVGYSPGLLRNFTIGQATVRVSCVHFSFDRSDTTSLVSFYSLCISALKIFALYCDLKAVLLTTWALDLCVLSFNVSPAQRPNPWSVFKVCIRPRSKSVRPASPVDKFHLIPRSAVPLCKRAFTIPISTIPHGLQFYQWQHYKPARLTVVYHAFSTFAQRKNPVPYAIFPFLGACIFPCLFLLDCFFEGGAVSRSHHSRVLDVRRRACAGAPSGAKNLEFIAERRFMPFPSPPSSIINHQQNMEPFMRKRARGMARLPSQHWLLGFIFTASRFLASGTRFWKSEDTSDKVSVSEDWSTFDNKVAIG
ncbi:uncharacterized protein BDR25DRAFT_352372 [Lindgomyces ingoldianus]|uniref:Uncharacterized protein n=1 Tax=Lindgomyces ingoldianus TaxID=673940 RepID=A0ACB6R3Q2_9PLEO|nr:uncharacterized protein BDR25DRAFT_352372 [Lindgomyces ingoldianus]KAF2473913.1 hypothetical protein BDR25DRAFT_352372 [Lindgomyces ingoldianus]